MPDKPMRELAADQILVQLKMFLKAENDPNFLLSEKSEKFILNNIDSF